MSSDNEEAAKILRAHEKRIGRLEEGGEPDTQANIIRVSADDSRLWEDVATSTTETTGTKWDTAEWDQSSSGGSVLNWS